ERVVRGRDERRIARGERERVDLVAGGPKAGNEARLREVENAHDRAVRDRDLRAVPAERQGGSLPAESNRDVEPTREKVEDVELPRGHPRQKSTVRAERERCHAPAWVRWRGRWRARRVRRRAAGRDARALVVFVRRATPRNLRAGGDRGRRASRARDDERE